MQTRGDVKTLKYVKMPLTNPCMSDFYRDLKKNLLFFNEVLNIVPSSRAVNICSQKYRKNAALSK
jgi:hypothetical protein